MMSKITRLAVALVAALSLALPLGACVGGGDDSEEVLHVWMRESDYRHYVREVFELYKTQTGNPLAVRVIPEESFDDVVAEAFASGDGPDVLLHYNDSALSMLGTADNFLVLNDQPWAESVMENARNYCDDGRGNLLGLPFWESSVSGCYYNKTVLDSMGLKPATTQAEFDALCQEIVNAGGTPLFWGDQCGWMYQFALDPIFADNPDLLARLNAGEINYSDIPEVRSMVQWIYDANQKGWLGDPGGLGFDDVSAPLASGDAVMVHIWDSWFETDFRSRQYGPEDFAVMPVFMGTSEDGTYEGGNLNMMLVNKNSHHLDEAVGFLEFCSQPEVFNRVFKGVPSVPVLKGQTTIVTSDMVKDAADSIEQHQRASTADPRILGYRQEDMKTAFTALLSGQTDVDGCINMMDQARIAIRDSALDATAQTAPNDLAAAADDQAAADAGGEDAGAQDDAQDGNA